jgi:hypothetical protein
MQEKCSRSSIAAACCSSSCDIAVAGAALQQLAAFQHCSITAALQ